MNEFAVRFLDHRILVFADNEALKCVLSKSACRTSQQVNSYINTQCVDGTFTTSAQQFRAPNLPVCVYVLCSLPNGLCQNVMSRQARPLNAASPSLAYQWPTVAPWRDCSGTPPSPHTCRSTTRCSAPTWPSS